MNTVAGTIQCCIPEHTANYVVACITNLSLQLLSDVVYM